MNKFHTRMGRASLSFTVFLVIFAFLLSGCSLGEDDPTQTPTRNIQDPLPDTGTDPAIFIVDQAMIEGTVSVAEVNSLDGGWVVIHVNENGAPGAVLGYAPVAEGRNQDIVIPLLETPGASRQLVAVLHRDAGILGSYEWPGPDEPIEVEGNPVSQNFRILAEGEVATSPTATVSTAPTSATTPTEDETSGYEVDLQLVAEGFTSPVVLTYAPGSNGFTEMPRLFVADQVGVIWIIDGQGGRNSEPFLDISDRVVPLNSEYDERGLLGLAFSPDYERDGRFFVYYSAPLKEGVHSDWDHTARLSEFRVSSRNPDLADADSERILLEIDQPQANNNGGHIAFGPDGYLYIPLGDGGGEGDTGEGHAEDWYPENPGGNGQDVEENLLGSILRIDINSGETYGIPTDNPFVNEEGLKEIFAYGFRNPGQLAFATGGEQTILVSDPGENLWEEINRVEAGGNYGWNVREGRYCFNVNEPDHPLADCPSQSDNLNPLIDPLIEYPNVKNEDGIGLAVIGGVIYNGRDLVDIQGSYLFGDWSSDFETPAGQLFIATPRRNSQWEFESLRISNMEGGRLEGYLLGFGQGVQNEVYVLTSQMAGPGGESGKIYRLVPSGSAQRLMTHTPTPRSVSPGSVTPTAPISVSPSPSSAPSGTPVPTSTPQPSPLPTTPVPATPTPTGAPTSNPPTQTPTVVPTATP